MTTSTTIALPHNVTLPAAYRLGAHISGSCYWLIRDADGEAVRCELRADLEQVNDDEAGDGDGYVMTASEVAETLEDALQAIA